MVTPASPTPPADDAAHRHPEIAQAFGSIAEKYDRARPRYPAALIDAIAERLPGHTLLDLGIGTGISAEPFRDRGFAVLGVEPDPKMAALARKKGFEVEAGRFEDWDSAGRTFDGVIAGQTWHWVDPVVGAAKAASVLHPAVDSRSSGTQPFRRRRSLPSSRRSSSRSIRDSPSIPGPLRRKPIPTARSSTRRPTACARPAPSGQWSA